MPPRQPTKAQGRILWNALTGLAIAVLFGLVIGFVYLFGNLLNYLQPVLVPVAVAGILAYLLDPVVDWIEKRGMTRLKAIMSVFALTGLAVILISLMVIPDLVRQTGEVIRERNVIGGKITEQVREAASHKLVKPIVDYWLERDPGLEALERVPTLPTDTPAPETAPEPAPTPAPAAEVAPLPTAIPFEETRLGALLETNRQKLIATGMRVLNVGGGKVFGALGYLLGFVMVPVYLFFFLKETAEIKLRWKDFVPLRQSSLKTEVVATLNEMNNYLVAFFRGQVVVSLIDGLLTGIALKILGLPYAFAIGAVLGILGVMPFIGFIVTLIPSLIIAAVHWGDWQHPLAVAIIFFVVQQIDGLFIQPKIIGDKVGLHPMTIIFSIFFWSLIFGGFLGALLAIPLTASVKVLFTRYIWQRRLNESPPCEDAALEGT